METGVCGYTPSRRRRTVSRYLSRLRRNGNAGQRWRTFLNNHHEVIAGMDFFTVMTANFRILYCLFLIRHDRREILHFNSTQHPTSEWIVQQLREAFPDRTDNQYLIFDREVWRHSARFPGLLRNFSRADQLPEPMANDRHYPGMLASGFNRCLAWAAFTMDILGQKLHE